MPLPWEIDWTNPNAGAAGAPPPAGVSSAAPTGDGGYDVPLPGQNIGTFNEGESDPGPPPGVNAKKYREERATEVAKNRQGLLQKAQHGRDFISQLDDYTDTMQQAPEWSFGPHAGQEWFRKGVDSPLATLGFSGPEEAARWGEVVNSKASAVTASLFRARFGGGPDETGQRGNRTEYQNIEKSIGTSGSFNKATALQAAYGHGKDVAASFNDALGAGQIGRDYFKDLSPKKIQVGVKSGAIDPDKFDVLPSMTPEQAHALAPGMIFRTTDGRVMTR
jgi:hypothetical protein